MAAEEDVSKFGLFEFTAYKSVSLTSIKTMSTRKAIVLGDIELLNLQALRLDDLSSVQTVVVPNWCSANCRIV